MIVDRESLAVLPIADRLLADHSDQPDEFIHGPISWSNELAAHVIELKTSQPVTHLDGLEDLFFREIRFLNQSLARYHACLLPTAMHPWMDPQRETRLWPHGNRDIYAAFDRIFDCRGHGWSNLQSVHLNLPFADEREGIVLHHAIRLLLPLLPGLAASSPFVEGQRTQYLDNRLHFYRHNCQRLPSLTGQVIPEPVQSLRAYHRLLQRLYRDLRPHDPQGILQEEWVNARGAIVRFERQTIEIRVLDVQEHPVYDLALLRSIVTLLRWLCQRHPDIGDWEKPLPTRALAELLAAVIIYGGETVVSLPALAEWLGWRQSRPPTVSELWLCALTAAATEGDPLDPIMLILLENGNLAARLRRQAGLRPDRTTLARLYRKLADDLESPPQP